MLTGTLNIDRFQGIEHFIPRLLDLSKGIRFRKLECWWDSEEDIQRTMTCIDACSDTLEYVDGLLSDPWYVHLRFCRVTGTELKLESQPGNLSEATKLKKK